MAAPAGSTKDPATGLFLLAGAAKTPDGKPSPGAGAGSTARSATAPASPSYAALSGAETDCKVGPAAIRAASFFKALGSRDVAQYVLQKTAHPKFPSPDYAGSPGTFLITPTHHHLQFELTYVMASGKTATINFQWIEGKGWQNGTRDTYLDTDSLVAHFFDGAIKATMGESIGIPCITSENADRILSKMSSLQSVEHAYTWFAFAVEEKPRITICWIDAEGKLQTAGAHYDYTTTLWNNGGPSIVGAESPAKAVSTGETGGSAASADSAPTEGEVHETTPHDSTFYGLVLQKLRCAGTAPKQLSYDS